MAKRIPVAEHVESLKLEALRSKLRDAGQSVKLEPLALDPKKGPRRTSASALRARGLKRSEAGEGTASLYLDDQGVLRWHLGAMFPEPPDGARRRGVRRGGRRRGGVSESSAIDGEIVEQFNVEPLGFSQVNDFLIDWDASLSPKQGLHEWKAGKLIPFVRNGRDPKRTLLIVHGTASSSQNMVDSLDNPKIVDPADKKTFLQWAASKYDLVLAFTHPTLSTSPFVNALRLERELADLPGTIDVVCHSRGGLVSRWWHEIACREPARKGKIVFACAPLFGTSLAAPSRVRESLDYLTNVGNTVGNVLGLGSGLFPFLGFATGLVRLLGAFTSALANTPAADIMMALAPGLEAQSRITNHGEMQELQKLSAGAGSYYAISAEFAPPDVPWWRFWENFTVTNIKSNITNNLFPGPHDLVVDTSSMTMLEEKLLIGKGAPKGERILHFGKKDQINHGTCFDDVRAVQFLKNSLK